ncbi:CBS domain-containing protein [Halobacteriales archaeon QS_9_67_15]|nr:MAG: CBS domain-containing protein [Halobacteriales archaeon QS_9_67_15]
MDQSILDHPVREIMNSPVRTVDYDMAVTDAARILLRRDIGSLVVKNGEIEGIVTESDIVEAVGAEHDTDRMTVGQLMTKAVLTVDSAESIEVACERMRANEIKKLPVTDGEELVGIVTTTDVTCSLVPGLDEVITSYQ